MPPSISTGSMGCLVRGNAPSISRAFSTSIHLSSIGPENPKFIEIPLPPQRYARAIRDVKGKLPPPRNVFHRRSPNKTDESFMALTIPEPAPENLKESKDERVLWKRQMAESRRTSLRDGIKELHERKVRQLSEMAYRSNKKEADRRRRLFAPQREDERLTNPTVKRAVSQPQSGFVQDPNRHNRILQMQQRVKDKEVQRQEARKDALHTLYMHARNFITTEEQLDVEVEKLFVERPFQRHTGGTTDNIWDAYGNPPSVTEMLSEVNKTERNAVDFHRGPARITGERMKRIAEELTGGKMD
jgi:hypothetical protein